MALKCSLIGNSGSDRQPEKVSEYWSDVNMWRCTDYKKKKKRNKTRTNKQQAVRQSNDFLPMPLLAPFSIRPLGISLSTFSSLYFWVSVFLSVKNK